MTYPPGVKPTKTHLRAVIEALELLHDDYKHRQKLARCRLCWVAETELPGIVKDKKLRANRMRQIKRWIKRIKEEL